MYIGFWIFSCSILLNRVIYSMLYLYVGNDKVCRNLYIVNILSQLILIMCMMYVMRTRKWPDYFSVDIQYQMLAVEEAMNRPDVLNANLTKEWVLNTTSSLNVDG